MKFILLILSLILINCASLVNCYDIYIDSKFSNEERLKIEEAISTWESATHNNVTFMIHDHELDDKHSINILYSNLDFVNSIGCDDKNTAGCTNRNKINDNANVFIAMDNSNGLVVFKQVIEHEIGHAIGLHHSHNGIMQALITKDMDITCDDVYAYYNSRDIKELCY